MMSFIGNRSLASAVSLIGLIVLVFFLSRLTGDPTSLYLPLDASLQSRENFRQLHGLNDPLLVQFGHLSSTCCASISATACARRGRHST